VIISDHLRDEKCAVVNSQREVAYGTLVTPLNLAGEQVAYNGQHVIESLANILATGGAPIERMRTGATPENSTGIDGPSAFFQ